MATWTSQQVLALAPDTSSAKSGRELGNPRKWKGLGRSEQALWGEIQGSGSKPYQTRVELDAGGPAYKCTCPSRKFPCKHALALMLVYAEAPASVSEAAPPDWVSAWLEERGRKAQKKAEEAAEPAKPVDAEAQAKRAAQRADRVAQGLDELGLWLADIARQGLASAQSQPHRFWENMAARLVDAQAPGAARQVRLMGEASSSGANWQHRVLERAALLHLLIKSYRRIDQLPPEMQANVRTILGWTQNQDEVLRQPGIPDRWLVLGQTLEQDERLRVQSTWLWGVRSLQAALVLQFAVMNQPLESSLVVGGSFEGELAFFAGAPRQRALVKQRGAAEPINAFRGAPGYESIAFAQRIYAESLLQNPWLERFAAPLAAVTPQRGEHGIVLRDTEGSVWPIAPRFGGAMELLAISGGRAITVFGEWDGHEFLPLSAWAEGRFHDFGRRTAE
jgi:hypothetical protein